MGYHDKRSQVGIANDAHAWAESEPGIGRISLAISNLNRYLSGGI
jgi:hypothetical protein